MRRLGYTIRKTLWFYTYCWQWTDPRTHWRKYAELQEWLARHSA